MSKTVTTLRAARVVFWLALAGATAWLLWYMVKVPGVSYAGAPKPLTDTERVIAANLRKHVVAVASREHNFLKVAELESAARYIEAAFAETGRAVATQGFRSGPVDARNIEMEVRGDALASEIIVVGAHYDSVLGAPGANDNGSGVAAVIELARLFAAEKPARTLRFVAFVNEEPPFHLSDAMGSRHYARRTRGRGENVVAMLSIETIGWYSDAPGSQRYPFPLGFFYPSTGNFIAFVSNLSSRSLLHDVIDAFRRHAGIPSEAVAAPAWIPGVDWSDHWSFWKEGYPALMVTDTAPYRYPHYHTSEDTPDKVDYDRVARVVTGLHGMLRDLAGVR